MEAIETQRTQLRHQTIVGNATSSRAKFRHVLEQEAARLKMANALHACLVSGPPLVVMSELRARRRKRLTGGTPLRKSNY